MSLIDDLENYSLDKTTYINLRWIGIIGQLITINVVAIILKFKLFRNNRFGFQKLPFWNFETIISELSEF